MKNWKSHLETAVDLRSGVNALIGQMGSGKSSVLEAISFALYGTTPALLNRTLKMEEMVRRFPQKADVAEVGVEFLVGEDEYSVVRKITSKGGEAELRKNGALVEGPSSRKVTEIICDILKMDFDLFSRVDYAEQNRLDYFLNLNPSERKKKIDGLLKLDRFESVRKNSITLRNYTRKLSEEKSKTLEGFEIERIREESRALEKGISEINTGLQEFRDDLISTQKDVDNSKENYKKMLDFRNRFEELTEKRSQLSGKLENFKSLLADASSEVDEEETQSRISEIDTKLGEIENERQGIFRIEGEIRNFRERKGGLESEIERLKAENLRFEKFYDLNREAQDTEKELVRVEVEISRVVARLQGIREEISSLKSSDSECPVCHEPLDEEKKGVLLMKKRKSQEELEEKKFSLDTDKEGIKKKFVQLKQDRDNLLRFQESGKHREIKIRELDLVIEKLGQLEKELNSARSRVDSSKVQELQEEKLRLRDSLKLFEIRRQEKQARNEMDLVLKEISEINFSQDEFDSLKERMFELQNKASLVEKDIASQEAILIEKSRGLKVLRDNLEKFEFLSFEVLELERVLGFLDDFLVRLEVVQVRLREEFNESLNYFMQEIWNKIYPYDDYLDIRLRGGEDYILEVLDAENNWISVDGQVSGGERHTAALVLRLALAVILSPTLKILVLDEPTHNLDSRAVETLSDILRDEIPKILDQLILITHEERMEGAVTGNLYRFNKKETEHGLTEVELIGEG